jgi:DivIVA domain-containing protein
MAWLFGVVVVLVLGGIAAVAAGRGGQMPENDRDLAPSRVPEDGSLGAQHLRGVRFPLALRGYRMSDVDALLSRLATQLETDDRSTQEEETERSTARSERPDAT